MLHYQLSHTHIGNRRTRIASSLIHHQLCLNFNPWLWATSHRNIAGVNGLLHPSGCTVVDFWYGRSTPLIFLHNFGGFRHEWSKVYPLLPPLPRVSPGLIGWGESAHPVRDYQIAD